MTSPNRETEAQQVEARVEQIVLTKVKASLMGKMGTIRVNLEQQRTITDQELQKTGMLRISKADRQETVKGAALSPGKAEMETPKISKAGHRETAKEAATNQEKATAVISDQEQEETEMPKADHRERAKGAATNLEKATAVISDQEKAGTGRAAPSGLRAQEAQEDHPASSHAHSKKAVLKKCQEMKAAVM
jgi:hypothetical protein